MQPTALPTTLQEKRDHAAFSVAVAGWAWALVAALLGHALLLQTFLGDGSRSAQPSRRPAAQLSWIALPAARVADQVAQRPGLVKVQPPATPDTSAMPHQRRKIHTDADSAAGPGAMPAAGSVGPAAGLSAHSQAPAAAPAPSAVSPDPLHAEEVDMPEPAGGPDLLPALPVYATRLPASFDLQFALRRGLLEGRGELSFRRGDAGAYALSLQLQAHGPTQPQAQPQPQSQLQTPTPSQSQSPALNSGRTLWQQSSTGVLADTGLQPDRFTDRRRGRQLGMAQFDRQAAQVRFSGRASPQPIAPAVQDRLSWLVQLTGAVAADAALQRLGAQVWLQVVGARGGYQVWVFNNLGPQTLGSAGASSGRALHFRREPERPYDTAVDVWLDPAQGFLPLQIHLTHVPSGDRIELLREP